jgi:hypothetical protein
MAKANIPRNSGRAALTPAAVRFQQDLSVGLAGKAHVLCLQAGLQFTKIVDFAGVDDPVAGFGILHGLMAKRREIEDSQPPAAQADFHAGRGFGLQDDGPRIVRAAVG